MLFTNISESAVFARFRFVRIDLIELNVLQRMSETRMTAVTHCCVRIDLDWWNGGNKLFWRRATIQLRESGIRSCKSELFD